MPVHAILDAGESATVTVPDGSGGFAADCTIDSGLEALDEVRAYVEDLELGVMFIATGPLAAGDTLEVATSFLGTPDTQPIVLTSSHRQVERRYLLPLTAYASDPAVEFTVTAVAADGTRISAPPRSWAVHTRGVLIAVDTPSPSN
jgi:hypothetical protein